MRRTDDLRSMTRQEYRRRRANERTARGLLGESPRYWRSEILGSWTCSDGIEIAVQRRQRISPVTGLSDSTPPLIVLSAQPPGFRWVDLRAGHYWPEAEYAAGGDEHRRKAIELGARHLLRTATLRPDM